MGLPRMWEKNEIFVTRAPYPSLEKSDLEFLGTRVEKDTSLNYQEGGEKYEGFYKG